MRTFALLLPALLLPACTDTTAGSDTGADGGGGSGGAGVTTSVGATGTGQGGASATSTTGAGPALGPELCPDPAVSVGFDVGQQLADIVVKDCAGNDVSLDTLCGASALWIFAAQGWCPLCKSVSAKQEAIVADYAAEGLVGVNVIVETAQYEPPTAAYCELWRETYGQTEVFTLYDPTGSILALWPGGSSSLSAFIDRDRIVASKLSYEADEATIRAEIEATLAR